MCGRRESRDVLVNPFKNHSFPLKKSVDRSAISKFAKYFLQCHFTGNFSALFGILTACLSLLNPDFVSYL